MFSKSNTTNSRPMTTNPTCPMSQPTSSAGFYTPNSNPFEYNNNNTNQTYNHGASINWVNGTSTPSLDFYKRFLAKDPAIDQMMQSLVGLEQKQPNGQIDSAEIHSLIDDIRAKVVYLAGKLDQQNQKIKFRNQMNEFLSLPNIVQVGLLNIQMVYSNVQQTKTFHDFLDQTVDSERDDIFLKNVQANANQLIVKLTSQLVCIGKLEYNLTNDHNEPMKAYIDIINNTIAKVLSYLQHPSGYTLNDRVLYQLIKAQLPFKMIHSQSELPKQPFWKEPSKWFLNPTLILLEYVKIASNLIAKQQNSINRPYLLSVIRVYGAQVREGSVVSSEEYSIAQTLALETVFYDLNLVLQQIKNSVTDFDVALLDSLLLELYRLCVPEKFSKLSDEMILSLADLNDTMLSQFGAIDIRNYFGLVDGEIEKNQEHSRLHWFLAYMGAGTMPPNNFGEQAAEANEIAESMDAESVPMNTEPMNEPVPSTSAETQSSFVPRNETVSITLPKNESPTKSPNSVSTPLNDELIRQIQTLQSELNASKGAIDQLTKLISGPNGQN